MGLRRVGIAGAGAVITLLLAELVCRLLPVSTATLTGYYFDADILSYPPGHTWTVSTGWDLRNVQHLRSNNLGFAADRDVAPDTGALVLIGDSYVEAASLAADERPAAQLQARLPDQRLVYGMGSPGTALLDYAQRIRFASQRLHSRDFVIWMEPGDARQALCGSGQIHSRCLDRRTLAPRIERFPAPSAFKRVARESALAQYIFGQLKFDAAGAAASLLRKREPVAQSGESSPDDRTRAEAASEAMVDAVLAEFFAQTQPYLAGRLLFVVDGERALKPQRQPTLLDVERKHLIHRLRERGVDVLDLEPVYAVHAAASPLSVEIGPYDHHLNALGIRLITAAIAGRLTQ